MSDELAIMVAATSDPEFKERLAKLREEQATIKREREAQQEEINQNAKLLVKAQEERLKAEALLSQAQDQRRQAEETHETAALAFKRVQEEEARFEAGRALVEKQHAERKQSEDERASRNAERQAECARAEHALRERDLAVTALEKRHAAAKEHARKFMAALNAPSS